MKILINDDKTIAELQDEFNSAFPYLKLEFFAKASKAGGSLPKKIIRNLDTTIRECRTTHTKGALTVVPEMTVAALVQSFLDVYGLAVRVARKSGKYWLQTSLTDFWTLEEQNRQGESLSEGTAAE